MPFPIELFLIITGNDVAAVPGIGNRGALLLHHFLYFFLLVDTVSPIIFKDYHSKNSNWPKCFLFA